MKPLKILVIDDEQKQRRAAIEALKGHDVATAGTFSEVREMLAPEVDEQKVQALLNDAGFGEGQELPRYNDGIHTENDVERYWEIIEEAERKSLVYPDFDVVLAGAIMSGEKEGQSDTGRKYVYGPIHYGFPIIILALKSRVKKVAIISNGQTEKENHHNHPLSWAMDCLHGTNIDDRLYVFSGYDCPCMDKERLPDVKEPEKIKDWATILNKVMGWEEEEKK